MDLLKILDTKPVPAIVDARILSTSENISGDYWLPTTMSLYQKELTDQIVSLHYSDILRYFETKDYKEDVILHSMETMCLNSEYVATHPYLLIDHHLPKSLITKDMPNHLAETSGKFAAMRDLINLVQEYETDTAIVCRPGRTMDLVEALLLSNKVNIKRYDGHSIKSKQKFKNFSCTCHLFSSQGFDIEHYPLNISRQFDMLICVDTSVNTSVPAIQSILRFGRDKNSQEALAPIVRLVAINSIDHCELYFEKLHEKETREFLENVTAAVVVLRDRVGTLPPDLRPIYAQNLTYLIDWLENPSIPWPLPDLYSIKKYTPMDVERSLLTEVHYSQIEDELEAAFSTVKKRGRTKGDRDLVKQVETRSFYKSKRLKNDYSTNPIKQDMAQLTGIATDDVLSNNYHLSSGILTHKLIQSIGRTYSYLKLQHEEIAFYECLDPIEKNRQSVYEDEKNAIEQKFSNVNSQQNNNLKTSAILEESNQTKIMEIENKEKDQGQLLKILVEDQKNYHNMKDLFLQFRDLQNEVLKEKKLSESKDMEKAYMEKEIERADNAIKEVQTEMNSKSLEVEGLQKQVKNLNEKASRDEDEIFERIKNLRSQIDSERASHQELEGKVGLVTEKLNKMQTPRVRMANSKSGTTRRLK
ncbi:HDA3 (YPR179C) [Zygosaccharomyces parabailii]|uniref:ZYBA0S06-06832g1_1 n=1 Tax=Zygosaccharomyces bailii (strain CLIB 213 / ATCC 58445 / CBS 680 / BCRC 21525 / NBRC 1098 / NCYC 1416 / NRRL Y-2227) TaxID=1333698 RepID=A0A8J2T8W6_ZYGB2|nr:HDA3 (YPR179C) [Zygosaccharomyces parabailii]CDF90364.1 ZYBA0S06-06832g1_1 [Zygosaccharomyces bailii CLIB 213]